MAAMLMPEEAPPGHVEDFDFLVGRWRVRHQRLAARLAGSTDWQEFEGECTMQKMLGGQANVDDNVIPPPDLCRWEQAFSADGGASWEISWRMRFERTG